MILIFKDKNTGAEFRQTRPVNSSLAGAVVKFSRPSAIEFTRRELEYLRDYPTYLDHVIRSMVDRNDTPSAG